MNHATVEQIAERMQLGTTTAYALTLTSTVRIVKRLLESLSTAISPGTVSGKIQAER